MRIIVTTALFDMAIAVRRLGVYARKIPAGSAGSSRAHPTRRGKRRFANDPTRRVKQTRGRPS